MGAGGSKGSVGCRDVEVSGVGSIGVCVCVCSGCQGGYFTGLQLRNLNQATILWVYTAFRFRDYSNLITQFRV